jgi:hypothetical protein
MANCSCGQPSHPLLGNNCEECFFAVAIEAPDGDYIRNANGDVFLTVPNDRYSFICFP